MFNKSSGLKKETTTEIRKYFKYFLGGPVNLPINTGDMSSSSGPGRFHMPRATKPSCSKAHMLQLLEPALSLKPVLGGKRSHHNENPRHHKERTAPACHN